MVKIKDEVIGIKDIVGFIFAIVLAILGYFIQDKLSSIDYSIKDFKQFQIDQSVRTKEIDGEIKILHAKDSELEKAGDNLQKQIDYCVKKK
jgi:hypothetical protein